MSPSKVFSGNFETTEQRFKFSKFSRLERIWKTESKPRDCEYSFSASSENFQNFHPTDKIEQCIGGILTADN